MSNRIKRSLDHPKLRDRHILIAEDDWFMAAELRSLFELHGAIVIGPAADLQKAMILIDEAPRIDDAVLDIRLQKDLVFPAAQKLEERGARIIFFSHYGQEVLPPQFAQHLICPKPADNLIDVLMN